MVFFVLKLCPPACVVTITISLAPTLVFLPCTPCSIFHLCYPGVTTEGDIIHFDVRLMVTSDLQAYFGPFICNQLDITVGNVWNIHIKFILHSHPHSNSIVPFTFLFMFTFRTAEGSWNGHLHVLVPSAEEAARDLPCQFAGGSRRPAHNLL